MQITSEVPLEHRPPQHVRLVEAKDHGIMLVAPDEIPDSPGWIRTRQIHDVRPSLHRQGCLNQDFPVSHHGIGMFQDGVQEILDTFYRSNVVGTGPREILSFGETHRSTEASS
jgi:hypothetical protein